MSRRDQNYNNAFIDSEKWSSANARTSTQSTQSSNKQTDLNRNAGVATPATTGATTENQSDFRVLRCFCGCSTYTLEQIEHFTMMNVASLIVHTDGKELFKNFLRIGHRNDKSEAMKLLECHEMCAKFLCNLHLIDDADQLDDLYALCPSFTWEQRIQDAIDNDKRTQTPHTEIKRILNDLKCECVHSIECHRDYGRFRQELLRKIGKWIFDRILMTHRHSWRTR